MANLTDADKVLRNDTGKDIVTKLDGILNAIEGTKQSLENLSDVNISNPSDNQALLYNIQTDKWENKDLPQKMDKSNPTGTGSFSLNRSVYGTVGNNSFAEGQNSTASGAYSHAEGYMSNASGEAAHAEGSSTASGNYSHSEGQNTVAIGLGSHAEGLGTTSGYQSQHVFGEYNVPDNALSLTRGKYVEIVGNGTSNNDKSNARTLDWDGNEMIAGDLTYNGSTSLTQAISDVNTRIDNLPEPMIFKGTLGVGGTVESLPAASAENEGWTYKVITAGTYAGLVCKVGDCVTCFNSSGSTFEWVISGHADTDTDTWRAIKVNGVEKLGNAISSGSVDFVDTTNVKFEFDSNGNAVKATLNGVDTSSEVDNKIAALIDDESAASNKTWSSEKIDEALGAKAPASEVTTISQELGRVIGDVYGGFVPDYHDGFYAEYQGKAYHNENSSWVYVVVDVSNFVGKTLTISTYADRTREILFTDDSDNVIDSVLIDTGNPNLYSTVSATVPTGATKCYINKYASGQNDIVIVGYYTLKLAEKSEVPQITQALGESENATLSQKAITDNFANSIEAIETGGVNVIPILNEDVAIYLDNIFKGLSPKDARLVKVNNAHVLIYDKTVALLPCNYGNEGLLLRLHLIDDLNKSQDITAAFRYAITTEKTANKKALFIGDSITQNLSYLTPLKALSDNGNYKLTFLGTLGTTIKNEGRQGWAAYNYANDSSALGATNAFWDGEKFNFSWYMSQNNIETPDFIFINLGTNDLIRGVENPSDDAEVKSVIVASYETMINSIRSYSANIPIILWLPPTRALVGRNNHTGIDNALRANKFLIEQFNNNTYFNNRVYLMPSYLFVNPYTDYTMSNVTINGVTYQDCSEPIHPTQTGGEKIAKGIMRQMMYIDDLLT